MKKKKRGKKASTIAIFVLLVALILLIGYNVLQVKHVKVVGALQYTTDEITKLAAIPAGTEMMRVDEKQIKENIESDPYLQLKSVDYELPDTLVLTINERMPAALLSTGTSFFLLDKQLVLLKDNDSADAGKYPVIAGIAIHTADVGKQIVTDDTAKIPALTAILDELKNQDATKLVEQIDLTDINNIVLKTKNGPNVLLGQPGGEAAKIAWVVKLLPDLISQGKTTGVLDVTAGSFATYGTNHMPAASAQPSQAASQQASPSTPTQSPSQGVAGSATIGASPGTKASSTPTQSPSQGVGGSVTIGASPGAKAS